MPRPVYPIINELHMVGILESAYLPCHEADGLDYCRLNNLLSWENAPCDSIRALARRVRAQVPAFVNHIIRNPRVSLDVRHEGIQQLGRREELHIRFLIHVPVAWTPTKRLVVAAYAIHCWL
jgi:hypothetical protein